METEALDYHFLLENIGGMYSQMSGIALCLYNYTVIDSSHKELKRVFLNMYISKSQHLLSLCKRVHTLGVEPRLWTCTEEDNTYWSPSFTNYPTQLDALLLNIITLEKEVIDQYKQHLLIIDDATISAMFHRFLTEETAYLSELLAFYKELC